MIKISFAFNVTKTSFQKNIMFKIKQIYFVYKNKFYNATYIIKMNFVNNANKIISYLKISMNVQKKINVIINFVYMKISIKFYIKK